MTEPLYRYYFPPDIAIEDVEASLLLSIWGVESLTGPVRSGWTPGTTWTATNAPA